MDFGYSLASELLTIYASVMLQDHWIHSIEAREIYACTIQYTYYLVCIYQLMPLAISLIQTLIMNHTCVSLYCCFKAASR